MARTHRNWNYRLAVTLRDSEFQPADVFGKGFDPGAVPGIDSDLAARVDALLGDGASATFEADELRQKCVWTPLWAYGVGSHLQSMPAHAISASRNFRSASFRRSWDFSAPAAAPSSPASPYK